MKQRRIVYLGMGGVYSLVPLEALVKAGAQVAAVVFPRHSADDKGPRWMPAPAQLSKDLELVVMPARKNILTLAGEQGIPVLEVGSVKDGETLKIIEELEPELVVVACFPQILPEAFLRTARIGCLNIHPSLLPAYRGPQPLFWQFRAGEKNIGVTVHWMDAGVDTGDILGQVEVSFPEGIRASEVDKLAAQAGANIILEALREDDWPRHPQGRETATYQGKPRKEDLVISSTWGARRAFNFMRAANTWAPFWIEREDGERIEVQEVLEYESGRKIERDVEIQAGETWVQMSDGALKVV